MANKTAKKPAEKKGRHLIQAVVSPQLNKAVHHYCNEMGVKQREFILNLVIPAIRKHQPDLLDGVPEAEQF